MRSIILCTFFLLLGSTLFSQKIKWEVDTIFSEITFDVNHLLFTNVEGEFFGFDGLAYSDSTDFSDINITFVIYPKSFATNNSDRDKTIKTEKFLDVENYKTIVFTSTQLGVNKNGKTVIEGFMTMLGNKKFVSFDLVYKGRKKDVHQREIADFEISGLIYPKEWGWNNPPFVSKKINVSGKVRLIEIGVNY